MEPSGTLVLVAIVLIMLFALFRKDSSRYGKMPPGPTPLPLIGNLLKMNGKTPHESFVKMSETYGPVMTVMFGPQPVVVLVGHEVVHEALVQQGDAFSGRAATPLFMKITDSSGLAMTNEECWKELRRFSMTTLRNFGVGKRSIEECIQEEAESLVKEFQKCEGSPCDPMYFLSTAVCNVICSVVCGKRFEYQDQNFIGLVSDINAILYHMSTPLAQLYNVFPNILRFLPGPQHIVLQKIEDYKKKIAAIIENHMETVTAGSPRDFIDSYILKMKEDDNNPDAHLNCKNLHGTVSNLLMGGTETTSTTLRYGLLILIKYPHIQVKIQHEIDTVIGRERCPAYEDRKNMPYTDAVVHEIQRFIDLMPTSLLHSTTKDTIFRGYTIPLGTTVIPLLHSCLYDKKYWETPRSFNPNHFLDENGCFKTNPAFVAFSTGKRVCIGEGLARMSLFLFFSILLQNLSFCSTGNPEEINLASDESCFVKVPQPYKLLVCPR
ncbi:cytochrome P450 2C20-like [Polypterus senegalus]|uniref:cytochrome P450 2C20-like n=1 Tax=Polypterus senegalus TaxID=55291 RepID=UPI0019652ED2|nr:cytochrome P450 2C20-like [Polypterus senegalus]